MKKIKLSGSILIKMNEDSSALALNLTSGEIFRFEGQIATLLRLLNENNKKNLSQNQLKAMFAKKSKEFAKQKKQDEAIVHGLNYLKEIGII